MGALINASFGVMWRSVPVSEEKRLQIDASLAMLRKVGQWIQIRQQTVEARQEPLPAEPTRKLLQMIAIIENQPK